MSIKRQVVYFEKPGKENTEETLRVAFEAAQKRDIDTILVSSTTGYTALKAMEIFKEKVKIIVVTHSTGYRKKGEQMMPDEIREKLERAGALVVTCTDVLTGAVSAGIGRQRPVRTEPQQGRLPWIVPPPNIIVANTLRMFSQGVKVCAEITAMVLVASESSRIREMRLSEILCKPQ
jgi:hypothetical protein